MAQIVTITNPLTGQPTQVDQLEHTAQQIDDAIARALPGGAIDKALAHNDPRQWGLGGGTTIPEVNDADSCTDTGWYAISSMSNCPFTYGLLRVEKWCDGCIFQTAYEMGSGNVVQRRKQNSEWKPWEYVNPPMVIGVEYRTTERYLGKPVYVKLVNCGEFATGATKRVAHGITMDSVVRAFGVRSNGESIPMTYTSNGTSYERINFMVGTSNVFITSENTASTGTLVVQIYYTKATD